MKPQVAMSAPHWSVLFSLDRATREAQDVAGLIDCRQDLVEGWHFRNLQGEEFGGTRPAGFHHFQAFCRGLRLKLHKEKLQVKPFFVCLDQ